MYRSILLVAILTSILLVSYLSYARLAINAEAAIDILTPTPMNRPPLGEVIYSPNERYAADIAVYNLYLRDTQTNRYIELDHQDIHPEGFAFNHDSTLLAAYGCVRGAANSHGYCGSERIVVWQLSDTDSTVVATIDSLAPIRNMRFTISDNHEYIVVSGCGGTHDAILGVCHTEQTAHKYWSVEEQVWVILGE
jgi:hypothetical protein